MEGLSTQSLRGGILKYVKDLGYRDESAERRQFVEKVSEELLSVLKRWEEDKAHAHPATPVARPEPKKQKEPTL